MLHKPIQAQNTANDLAAALKGVTSTLLGECDRFRSQKRQHWLASMQVFVQKQVDLQRKVRILSIHHWSSPHLAL